MSMARAALPAEREGESAAAGGPLAGGGRQVTRPPGAPMSILGPKDGAPDPCGLTRTLTDPL